MFGLNFTCEMFEFPAKSHEHASIPLLDLLTLSLRKFKQHWGPIAFWTFKGCHWEQCPWTAFMSWSPCPLVLQPFHHPTGSCWRSSGSLTTLQFEMNSVYIDLEVVIGSNSYFWRWSPNSSAVYICECLDVYPFSLLQISRSTMKTDKLLGQWISFLSA